MYFSLLKHEITGLASGITLSCVVARLSRIAILRFKCIGDLREYSFVLANFGELYCTNHIFQYYARARNCSRGVRG